MFLSFRMPRATQEVVTLNLLYCSRNCPVTRTPTVLTLLSLWWRDLANFYQSGLVCLQGNGVTHFLSFLLFPLSFLINTCIHRLSIYIRLVLLWQLRLDFPRLSGFQDPQWTDWWTAQSPILNCGRPQTNIPRQNVINLRIQRVVTWLDFYPPCRRHGSLSRLSHVINILPCTWGQPLYISCYWVGNSERTVTWLADPRWIAMMADIALQKTVPRTSLISTILYFYFISNVDVIEMVILLLLLSLFPK